MEWHKDNYLVTDDKKIIDIDFVTAELNKTYWAEGRSREMTAKSIEHSVFFSMLDGDRMIGFARIVTDYSTFAWLCDVYVHPDYRGNGLGVWLMDCVYSHPSTDVWVNLLATRDAHGLYEKFGFERKECMLRIDRSKQPQENCWRSPGG
ncbi:MAG: GNAT family N-acetyltransferase [Candidatus Zixiibacteriota bacterium]|nr:MAG: GNAT family N-acetyltransferase [candidate division Zixibacteria bacterium]